MVETRNTFRWDSVGADRVKRDYAEVQAANDKTAGGFQKTGAAAGQAGAGVDKLGTSTKAYGIHAEVASKSTTLLGVGIAALGAAAVAAAAIGTMTGALMKAVGALDDLGDKAQQLGLTTTALQELQDAARRSDADVETLNGSWAKFTKAVGEATQGSGKLNDILKQYNIALKNADGSTRSTMALYLDLADAAKQTGDSTEIARIAVGMFGKEGISLASMLVKGADGFREMAKEAHEAGRIVSEDLVEAAGEMQATYDRMLDTLTAKWRTFAVTAAAVIGLIDAPLKMQLREQLAGTQEQLRAIDFVIDRQKRGSDEYTRNLEVRAQLLAKIALLEKNIAAPSENTKPRFVAPESEGDANAREAAALKAAAANEKAQRAAAAATADRLRLEGEEFTLMNKMTDAYFKEMAAADKLVDSRNEYQQSLADELNLLGLSERARALEIERLNAEREAVGLVGDERAKYIADAVAARGVIFDTQQTIDEAKKAADEVQAIWDDAAQGIHDAWGGLFTDLFDGGKVSFKSFANDMRQVWAKLLSDLIMQSMQKDLMGSLFSTGAGGTRDAFKNAFDGSDGSVSDSLGGVDLEIGERAKAGLKDQLNDIFGEGFSKKAGEFLNTAALGMTIGSVIGGKEASAGGAAGALIGKALGGPLGSLIGSVLGGIVGSLFNSTPKSISSYGTGGVTDSMAAGGLDVKIGKDMATAVVRALRTFSEQLVVGLESDEFLGIVGQRGKKFFYQAQETDLKVAGKKKYGAVKFDSAEEAIAAAIEAAINAGVVQGLTDADKKLMRAAGSVEQAMQDVVSSHNFKRELDFQFIGLSSPLAEAQARLEFEYQQQLILAEKYEADKTKLEAVYAQKRLDLVQQYNEQQYAGLKSFLTSITAGSASPLSPTTRLGLAQANYQTLRQKALAGDQDAIAALQGAAQDYLGASRDVYASSGGFQTAYQQVVADLSSITGMANPLGVGAAANSNVAAAVNDNTRYQAQWFTQAATQRESTNTKLDTLITLMAPVASALNRGAATPTQNGTVNVGTIDWAGISQAVASIR